MAKTAAAMANSRQRRSALLITAPSLSLSCQTAPPWGITLLNARVTEHDHCPEQRVRDCLERILLHIEQPNNRDAAGEPNGRDGRVPRAGLGEQMKPLTHTHTPLHVRDNA